jgi:hypothetical protein
MGVSGAPAERPCATAPTANSEQNAKARADEACVPRAEAASVLPKLPGLHRMARALRTWLTPAVPSAGTP